MFASLRTISKMPKKPGSFGSYIRTLRFSRNIGQRQMAKLIGISPSYLNDIESGRRKPPGEEKIRRLANILEANLPHLYDLAGRDGHGVPPDIQTVFQRYPGAAELLRAIRDFSASDATIKRLTELTRKEIGVKAIIVAAGMGKRLKHYTDDLPKCLLKFKGKTLMQRQLEALRSCGVHRIVVVKGYKQEKINYKGIKYYINKNFRKNNILNSFFYAEKEMEGELVLSYSDILYEKQVVERLLSSKNDISIVVDIDWRGYYEGRTDHPIEEAENVILDANNRVMEIGKILTRKHDVHGEFIGMMKLTPRGTEIFKRHFYRAKKLFWGKPFQRARTFEKAYLTDILQDMIEMGVDIHAVIIERGWSEIDTVQDYEKAVGEFKK